MTSLALSSRSGSRTETEKDDKDYYGKIIYEYETPDVVAHTGILIQHKLDKVICDQALGIVTRCSQIDCHGEFDESEAHTTIRTVYERMSLHELIPGIRLDESRLPESLILSGGTCSAITLFVASRLIKLHKYSFSTFSILERQIEETIEAHTKQSNKTFRSIQAAFNTIVVPKIKIITPSDKIKLLAIYYSLFAVAQSQIFLCQKSNPILTSQIADFLKTDGVYVVRAIKNANLSNKDEVIKQECRGHTTLIFRQTIDKESRSYFMDPSYGIVIIDRTKDLGTEFCNLQGTINEHWGLDRFQIIKFDEAPA